jgi:molybdopterin synthase catalytic subunit
MLGDVRIQVEDFDVGSEIARAASASDDIGAIASFVGLCRGEGGSLEGIEIEAYPAMARVELDRILQAASARWALDSVAVVHRFGRISVGERIVLVVVAARHRGDAFAAAEFIMDFLKQSAPFWKRGLNADGDREASRWIGAKSADAVAASRWNGANVAATSEERLERSGGYAGIDVRKSSSEQTRSR